MPRTSHSSVIKQLKELRSKRRGKVRDRKVWTALLQAETADDLAVGMDYAIESELIEGYFAPHFRGEAVESVADRYWVHPLTNDEMVWIPAGEYLVGEEEQRPVRINGLFLARYPVTNQQYYEFMEEAGYVPNPEWELGEQLLAHYRDGAPRARKEEHPVTWVSYFDAMAYCEQYRMCLPTEWEWEAAARGSDGRPFPWGSEPVRGYEFRRGNYIEVNRAHLGSTYTVPVDRFAKIRTPFGCEQLVGNVSEWCEAPETKEHEDDKYGGHLRPVRGSCYKRKMTGSVQSSHRRFLSAGRRNDWVGFRPALIPSKFAS